MKKSILLFGLLIIILNCSDRSDSNSKNEGNEIIPPSTTPPVQTLPPNHNSKFYLVRKVTTSLSSGENKTKSLSYIEDMLQEEVHQTPLERKIFYYNNDKVVKISTSKETLTLVYDNIGKLKRKTTIDTDGSSIVETFIYIDSNTITSKKEIDGTLIENITYRLKDEINISSIKTSNANNTIITTTYYEYDNNKNPYYNIKGFSSLNNPYYSKNNITGIRINKRIINSDGTSVDELSTTTFTHVYNTDLYPTEIYINRVGKNGKMNTTKLFYEYN